MNNPSKLGDYQMIKKWIDKRLAERSTIDGALMIAAGAAIVVFSPFAKLIAYGAIVYGVYTVWRND
jgi:hypothetical protein